MERVEDVVIVGAGIAGLATAVALKRVGVQALVLERSEGLRATGAALTLFPNAWLALNALGVSHKLTSLYTPSKMGRITNVETGSVREFSFAGSNNTGKGVGPRSVHRKILLQALAFELPSETIHFSSKLSSIEMGTLQGLPISILTMEDGNIIKAKILIGCDGVHSMVGRWLGLAGATHSGRSAARGLAVYPRGHGLGQVLNQLKDVGKRAGFIPLNDKEVYWYFTCQSPPKVQGAEMEGNPELIQREVLQNYARNFPEQYLDIVGHSDLSTVTWAPLMYRKPWNIIFGNLSKGNITVAGDAMHPMTPDLGQGGCAALEDAVVLGRYIGNSLIANEMFVPGEMAAAIQGYALERRWRVAWLVTGSYSLGWVQLGETKHWWIKFFRAVIFIILSITLVRAGRYNCGDLPSVCYDIRRDSMKID